MADSIRLRQEDLLWQAVDDEIVVLDLRWSKYLRLNGSGVVLWGLLENSATKDEMTATLVSKYGIGEERASADVDSFIDKLAKKKLLQ